MLEIRNWKLEIIFMLHKRILLATRPLVPPWDEASKNFAYFLGIEVKNHLLTLLTTKTPLADLPESVHTEPLFESGHFDFSAKRNLFLYLRRMRKEFDITHYLFTPTIQNTRIIRWFAKPSGKTIQTIATLRDDIYSDRQLKRLFFADRLVVYTDRTKEKLIQLGFHNVIRIYPGIDLHHYAPQAKNEAILTELGLSLRDFVVIYPGEYARLGATDMIADAFFDFFRENPETNLRFVFACRVKNEADAEKKQEIHQRFANAHLLDYIAFSDTISDMPGLYNASDVVIFPVENLKGKFDVPLVIIEAYACSKPVILSDLSQFLEFANKDICVTIPKDSGEKLIESLAYLKENEAERTRLGTNARQFVTDHFDLKNTAKQYEEIYTSL